MANLPWAEYLSAPSATPMSLTASDLNQTALAANEERRGAFFQNNADKACYLKFGVGASPSSYTVKMDPLDPADPNSSGGTFELGSLRAMYTGRIDVVWPAGVAGALAITELNA